VGRHLTRWLIPLPAIVLSFWPTIVRADAQPGLNTTYYTIDEIPPVQSTTEYPVCGTEVENNINRNYDYELFEDCTYDLFMVHMTGFIDIPEHDTIELMLASDDGGEMIIDGNTFGNWNDQGCTWMMSGELMLEPGSNAFDVWMYEHGGNACLMLAWNINNEGWMMVPDSAFTQQAVAPTTTILRPQLLLQPPVRVQRQPQQHRRQQQRLQLQQPFLKKRPQPPNQFSQAQPHQRQVQRQVRPQLLHQLRQQRKHLGLLLKPRRLANQS